MTFGAHKLVRSEPFFTTNANFDNCCQRQIATYGKQIIYRCTSVFSAVNQCGKILFKIFLLSIGPYEMVRTHFIADFWSFYNFRENCGVT